MKIFIKIVALLVVLGILGAVSFLIYVKATGGFSARTKPTTVEALVARATRNIALPMDANELKNPLEITPLLIAEARDHFADHCAVCHGNKGDGKTMINEGLYPPAPDMREQTTQGLTDGELFYLIKNGIRLSGMPGWGGEDADNWKLVAFIRHLPKLSEKELELMSELNGMSIGGTSHEPH
jgi:mono/diheme cytochrome c family protein